GQNVGCRFILDFDIVGFVSVRVYGDSNKCQADVFSTPNYPRSYPLNIQCEWTILVAEQQVISVKFITFDVDDSDDVVFYDGDSNQSPVLERYSNFWNNETLQIRRVRSTGNKLHVLFNSGAALTGLGFAASYWAHECKHFMYGLDDCNTTCPCEEDNTAYCNNTSGDCVCKTGWTSKNCSEDINECKEPQHC
ncbi:unnamed protein product, partial [Lymnaea stagnalis]